MSLHIKPLSRQNTIRITLSHECGLSFFFFFFFFFFVVVFFFFFFFFQ